MMRNRWLVELARLGSSMWLRASAFAVMAVVLALVAGLATRWLPDVTGVELGQDAVQPILQILATSMLAVTTFSLTAMISAYASASAGTTPRATQLLIADPTSQNALATFLGSFVFAIVGIVALSTGYYGEQGRVVLYGGTLVVIVIIVVTLTRWIHHLTGFGRMADVLDRVEEAATATACAHARRPHLGGVAPVDVPAAAREVRADAPGCVTGIAMDELTAVAREHGLTIHVRVLPGVTVGWGGPLAWVEGALDDAVAARVRRAFRIEAHRTFEQDPRLGFVALAEIGSRALSQSTNDPGSAIEALNAVGRVLTRMLTAEVDPEVAHPRVHVPAVSLDDIIEDALRPVARDGAGVVEIGLRLQRVVGEVIAVASEEEAEALRAASRRAEERAHAGLVDAGDAELVARAARDARSTSAGSARHV